MRGLAAEPAATPHEIAAILAVLETAGAAVPAPARPRASAWRAAALREGTTPFDPAVAGQSSPGESR